MKVAVKEKVKLSFVTTADADTIRFFLVQWTVDEAKHTTYDVNMLEGTCFPTWYWDF